MPETTITLPASLTVEILGEPITCKVRKSAAGAPWYKGSTMVVGDFSSDIATKVLSKIVAKHEGATLKAGEVHISAPRKFGKNHEKAGQVMPNTGGNLSVTHSASIAIADTTGEKHGFTLMVRATHITKAKNAAAKLGISVTVQALPQTAGSSTLEGADELAKALMALVDA